MEAPRELAALSIWYIRVIGGTEQRYCKEMPGREGGEGLWVSSGSAELATMTFKKMDDAQQCCVRDLLRSQSLADWV